MKFAFVAILLVSSLCVGHCWIHIGASTNPSPATPAQIAQVEALRQEMQNRWEALDATCDPAAAFAVTYLVMTTYVKNAIVNNYFDWNGDMTVETLNFAARYSNAINAWIAGNPANITQPWKEAFYWGATNQSSVTQDLMLGMSAHINYDLAIATDLSGYSANPSKYKTDYDRINDVLQDALPPVATALSTYYDSLFTPGGINDLVNGVVLEIVIGWRANAWNNAVGMSNALTPLGKASIVSYSEVAAVTAAKTFELPNIPPTNPARTIYCQTHPSK